MSFNTLLAGHRNDARQRDDQILRCVVNGCDTLEYGSLICKAHSNPAHRNILNTVSQLQSNMRQPGPDPTVFFGAQSLSTSEVNLQTTGSPHMDTPALSGAPQSSFSVHNRQQTGTIPPISPAASPAGELVWCHTNLKAFPANEKHYPEQHKPPTIAQQHGGSNGNPPHQHFPPYSVRPSPKLPPMRTLPPREGTPAGQQFEGTYGDVPSQPVVTGTLAAAAVVTTKTTNNSQSPASHNTALPNSPYRHGMGIETQKLQHAHKRGRAGIKNNPSEQRVPLAQGSTIAAPALLSKPSLPKRSVIVVDLTDEPSPPPGMLLQSHKQPFPTEQPRKPEGSLIALAPKPLQTPPSRKRKILPRGPEEPVKAAPVVQPYANPGTNHPSATQMEKQETSLPPTPINQTAVTIQPAGAEAQIRHGPEPVQSRLDTNAHSSKGGVLSTSKPINGNHKVKDRSQTKTKTSLFDSVAFDTLIYQQEGAALPPEGVSVPVVRNASKVSFSRETQLYLPTNPLIHRPYTRSQEWADHKNEEIRSRPRRKRWFGKAAERQRWLWANNDTVEDKGKRAQREDPQPWTYGRPLDYGDISADNLPLDVLQNPAWAKACAWHRNTRQMEYLRRRERQRAAEQTRQFLRSVLSTSSIC